MRLTTEILHLRTRHPFIIARGGQSEYRTVMVRLTDADGVEGWGEAAATAFYGETLDTVQAALQHYAPVLGDDPFALETVERAMEKALARNPAARAAVSMALHDLVGKRLGVSLWKLWGLDRRAAPRSTFTIGIDSLEKIAEKTREAVAAGYPVLKVKIGGADDAGVLETVSTHFDGEIRVDANAAWSASEAIRMLPLLADHDVTVLEQPVASGDIEGLRRVREAAEIPVIADESCITSADIPRVVGAVDGINIKLAKCGSLREALRMIAIARAHHLHVMIGCMIESSLAITAAAHLSPLVDFVDLDGAALLVNDPFAGAGIPQGRVTLPDGPGLGVSRR